MIIDTHVHLPSIPIMDKLGPNISRHEDLIKLRMENPEIYTKRFTEIPTDNSEEFIADMDKNGIGIALVQPTPGRVINEDIAEIVKKHPGRLYGLATINNNDQPTGYMDDPAETRKRAPDIASYCIEELGMKGIGETWVRALTKSIHPEEIAKDLKPLMETLSYYKVPIQFPTAWSQFKGNLYYNNPIWVDEVAGEYPDVPIILTKMGRSIGYYFDTSMVVALRNTNVYFDVVGTSPEHLKHAIEAIGANRIMFGSDWSTSWRWIKEPEDLYTIRLSVLDDAGLSTEEREAILWQTAANIFKINV